MKRVNFILKIDNYHYIFRFIKYLTKIFKFLLNQTL
jgi:hypothetical protein